MKTQIVSANKKLFVFHEKDLTIYENKWFSFLDHVSLPAPIQSVALRSDNTQIACLCTNGAVVYVYTKTIFARTTEPAFGKEDFERDSFKIQYAKNDSELIVSSKSKAEEYYLVEWPDENGYYDLKGLREKNEAENQIVNDYFTTIFRFSGEPVYVPVKTLMNPFFPDGFEECCIDLTKKPKLGYFDADDDLIVITYQDGTVRIFEQFYDSVELLTEFGDSHLQRAFWSPIKGFLIVEYDDGKVAINDQNEQVIYARMDSYVFIDEKHFAFADQKGVHICDLQNYSEPYLLPLVKEHGNFCGYYSYDYRPLFNFEGSDE